MQWHVPALAALLIATATGIAGYKAQVLGYPITPEASIDTWLVEAKLSFEGVDDEKAFESAWATKPALPAAEAPAAAEAPVAEAPAEAPKTWAPEALKQTKEQKEELAADAEIAKLKAELKALRGDGPLPPADYGTTQV